MEKETGKEKPLVAVEVPKVGIEPTIPREHEFESCASASSATSAIVLKVYPESGARSSQGADEQAYNHYVPLNSLDIANHLYFVTAATIRWIELFKENPFMKVVLESFEWHRAHKKFLLFAFVVMPSHWHAIIKPGEISIGNCLQSFCSFTAHRIVDLLRAESRFDILEVFHQNKRDPKSNYSVWQEAFTENIFTENFLVQKMEYIHRNPVRGKKLVEDRADYLFSSARFYDLGIKPVIEIDDINAYLSEG